VTHQLAQPSTTNGIGDTGNRRCAAPFVSLLSGGGALPRSIRRATVHGRNVTGAGPANALRIAGIGRPGGRRHQHDDRLPERQAAGTGIVLTSTGEILTHNQPRHQWGDDDQRHRCRQRQDLQATVGRLRPEPRHRSAAAPVAQAVSRPRTSRQRCLTARRGVVGIGN